MIKVKLDKREIYISSIPDKEQLEKLTNKELFAICLRNNMELKQVLVDS